MSSCSMEKIKCPKCGKMGEFRVWKSINTTLDSELKEKVKTGKVFHFTCPECGNTANVDYGFLYHDMEKMMMIYYVQNEENFKSVYNMFTQKSDAPEMDMAMSGYLRRIVTSQNQLREKIYIFDAGLDDRIIEIIKLIHLSQIQNQHPEMKADEARYFKDTNGNHMIQFMAAGKGIASAKISDEIYKIIVEDFGTHLPEIREDEIMINLNWALKIFESKNNK